MQMCGCASDLKSGNINFQIKTSAFAHLHIRRFTHLHIFFIALRQLCQKLSNPSWMKSGKS